MFSHSFCRCRPLFVWLRHAFAIFPFDAYDTNDTCNGCPVWLSFANRWAATRISIILLFTIVVCALPSYFSLYISLSRSHRFHQMENCSRLESIHTTIFSGQFGAIYSGTELIKERRLRRQQKRQMPTEGDECRTKNGERKIRRRSK